MEGGQSPESLGPGLTGSDPIGGLSPLADRHWALLAKDEDDRDTDGARGLGKARREVPEHGGYRAGVRGYGNPHPGRRRRCRGRLSEVARPQQRGLLCRVGVAWLASGHPSGDLLQALELPWKKPADQHQAHLGDAAVSGHARPVDQDQASYPPGMSHGKLQRQVHAS